MGIGIGIGISIGNNILGGAAALAPYLGQVATRSIIPTNRHSSAAIQASSRSIHTARDTITALQLGFVNWQTTAGGSNPTGTAELNGNAVSTIKASVEYPLGSTPQLVLWAGANTKAIAAGALEISDVLTKAIPNGAKFAVRTYRTQASGNMLHTTAGNAAGQGQGDMTVPGDFYLPSATTTPDITLDTADPGVSANTQAGAGYYPALILGQTMKPSVAIIGDSIAYGSFDLPDSAGDMGSIARVVGQTLGYTNIATPGERLMYFALSNAKRAQLLPYVSNVILALGRNDVSNARTLANYQADFATAMALFTGKKVHAATMTPRSTSTDNWTALAGANQTVETNSAIWISINDWLRTGAAGLSSVFSIDDASAISRVVDKWITTGVAFATTGDGTHPAPGMYQTIKNSGVINPALIVR